MRSNRFRALVVLICCVLALGAELVASTQAGAAQAGTVRAFGGAPSLGAPTAALSAPIVGIGATRSGRGYWLLGQDGGIFSFGDAHFYGSTGALRLNQPIIGMAPTRSGHGYWLVASDGGIFSFGDAHFYGSTGGSLLFASIAGMTTSPTGNGYWLAAADGRVFSFGSAPAMGRVTPASPIAGVQVAPGGTGLWLVARDGAVYTTGTARFAGGANGGFEQAVGIARAAHGYWIATVPSGPPLPPNSGTGRRIVYSNSQQRVWTVEDNGVISHTFLVSGRHGLPSAGVHQVFSKVTSSPSGNLTLPWTLRFAISSSGNPIDFHGIPLRPDGTPIEDDSLLGTPQSHGCVRMNQGDAKVLWDWATVGTTVVVTDIGY